MKPIGMGWMGTLLLFVGVFTPIVSVPFMGGVNDFRNGGGDGVFVLILASISAFLSLKEKYLGLYVMGGVSLLVMLLGFLHFKSTLSAAKAEMERGLASYPFKSVTDIAMELQFQ